MRAAATAAKSGPQAHRAICPAMSACVLHSPPRIRNLGGFSGRVCVCLCVCACTCAHVLTLVLTREPAGPSGLMCDSLGPAGAFSEGIPGASGPHVPTFLSAHTRRQMQRDRRVPMSQARTHTRTHPPRRRHSPGHGERTRRPPERPRAAPPHRHVDVGQLGARSPEPAQRPGGRSQRGWARWAPRPRETQNKDK